MRGVSSNASAITQKGMWNDMLLKRVKKALATAVVLALMVTSCPLPFSVSALIDRPDKRTPLEIHRFLNDAYNNVSGPAQSLNQDSFFGSYPWRAELYDQHPGWGGFAKLSSMQAADWNLSATGTPISQYVLSEGWNGGGELNIQGGSVYIKTSSDRRIVCLSYTAPQDGIYKISPDFTSYYTSLVSVMNIGEASGRPSGEFLQLGFSIHKMPAGSSTGVGSYTPSGSTKIWPANTDYEYLTRERTQFEMPTITGIALNAGDTLRFMLDSTGSTMPNHLLAARVMPLVERTDSTLVEYVPAAKIAHASASSADPYLTPDQAFDGIENNADNCWHTPWSSNVLYCPHWIMAEFTEPLPISSLTYVARSATNFQHITRYEVWTSTSSAGDDFIKSAEGQWPANVKTASADFLPVTARRVKLVVLDTDTEGKEAAISELKFGYADFSCAAGTYEQEITSLVAQADTVLSAASDIGTGAYQYKQSNVTTLTTARNTLNGLKNSGNPNTIAAATSAVTDAIYALLGSNKAPEESMTLPVSKSRMSASASTQDESDTAGKAVDGDRLSVWRSEGLAAYPHSLTVDLGDAHLFNTIALYPLFSEMTAGRIQSGEIYAGNTPGSMTLLTSFSMLNDSNPAVVGVPYTKARYIMITSLEGITPYTAIAEVDVYSFTRGLGVAVKALEDAYAAVDGAVIGSNAKEYPQSAVNTARSALNSLQNSINSLTQTNSDFYALADSVFSVMQTFADSVNPYTLSDLQNAIAGATALLPSLGADAPSMQGAITEAATVANNSGRTNEEIEEAINTLAAITHSLTLAYDNALDLSGEWKLSIGPGKEEFDMAPIYTPGQILSNGNTVTLPGTLYDSKKGYVNTTVSNQYLTRYYKYEGFAAYQKDIFIPLSAQGSQISLFMERSRETKVFVGSTEVLAPGRSSILPVSQEYDLSAALQYGQMNTITIIVDNHLSSLEGSASYPILVCSHMGSDQTQTNWNGIVGAFELRKSENVNIAALRVYPNTDLASVTVEADIKNGSASAYNGTLSLQVPGLGLRQISVSVPAGESKTVSISDYSMGSSVLLWDEFTQNLYTMNASLANGSAKSESFGMRRFSVDPDTRQIKVNNIKTFVRGETNSAVFPLTAYAPMDEATWENLLGWYKAYGFNMVRFHSWCPPEAAFAVADRLGLYLQPELSSWDAENMFSGYSPRETQLERDYYTSEAYAILREYANHPSFVFMTFGNELKFVGDGMAYADQLIVGLKAKDPTRLYSFASNGSFGEIPATANSDFFEGQKYKDESLRGCLAGMSGFINQEYPSSTVNYNSAVVRHTEDTKNDPTKKAMISFEVGQFQVFPDVLTEIEKYNGVLYPGTLVKIRSDLKAKGYTDEIIEKIITSSGEISRIGYRMEVEAALRTTNLGGICLLTIQDFTGQDIATVGMLDPFGQPKPYAFSDPAEFRRSFDARVALFQTEKFVWTNQDSLTGDFLFSNFGPAALSGTPTYTLTYKDSGAIYTQSTLTAANCAQGTLSNLGSLSIDLSSVTEAVQMQLEVRLGDVFNYYDFWVYPAVEQEEGDVYVVESLTDDALDYLNNGGKVFLSPPARKDVFPHSVAGCFTSSFWASFFFSESQPCTMGLSVDPEHPIFDTFPTEFHANYQWWAMVKLGRPMILDSFKDENGRLIDPLFRVGDSNFSVKNLGLLYEAKIGAGKLMVSSMGLDQLQKDYPEAAALRQSILNYMNSDEFDPQFEVSDELVRSTVIIDNFSARENIAEQTKGALPFIGPNTYTTQYQYDKHPQDRTVELNNGVVDCEDFSRSWSDWGMSAHDQPATVGIILSRDYWVDTIDLPFFANDNIYVPSNIVVQYWTGSGFANVPGQSHTSGFGKGRNEITFSSVYTSRIQVVMTHAKDINNSNNYMGIALSEILIYETVISPTEIQVVSKTGASSVAFNKSLAMTITTVPDYVNDDDVVWSLTDLAGHETDLAAIGFNGVLKAKDLPGRVVVTAKLKSNPTIKAFKTITIGDSDDPYDVDGDGLVNANDLLILKKAMLNSFSDSEYLDVNQDTEFALTDLVFLKKHIVSLPA